MGKLTSITLALILISSGAFLFMPTRVESGGSGDYPPPGFGDWIITSPTHVGNETLVLNGNLTILPTGSLTFHNVTLKMNCTVNGSYHINVTTGSSFYIYDLDNDNTTTEDASVITSNYADGEHRYLFWVQKDANFILKNSELHECGYNYNANKDQIGLFIQSNNALIDHSLISNNYYGMYLIYANITVSNNTIVSNYGNGGGEGIWAKKSNPLIINNYVAFHPFPGLVFTFCNGIVKNNTLVSNGNGINTAGASTLIIENNTILSSLEDGIAVTAWATPIIQNNYINGGNYGIASTTGAMPQIMNSTIENIVISDIAVGPDCQFTMINCTFNRTKIYFSDSLSELTVQQYLHTYVNDSNNLSIPDTEINIKDIFGSTAFIDQTRTNGWLNWTVVTEYVQKDLNGDSDGGDPGEKVYHTSHNISASKIGYSNGYAEVNMNESKILTLTLTPLSNFTQPLIAGWNLASLPLIQNNESIDSVLQSIDGKWDRIYVYNTTDASDPWKSHNIARPEILNDLNKLNHRHAIWINVTEICVLEIWGIEPTTSNIPLYSGWNFVGYPSSTETPVSDALMGTGYDGVEGYNATSPYMITPMLDTDMMVPGRGYWVHVPADTVWVVDW